MTVIYKFKSLWLGLLIASFFLGCSGIKSSKLSKVDWLLGNWTVEDPNGIFYESWTRQSDVLLNGRSYKIVNGDTNVLETMVLRENDKGVWFCPAVVNQNEGKVIEFRLKGSNMDSLVFENLVHDFPQRIAYVRKEDHIDAWIEGNYQNQGNRRIAYYFRRDKK